MKHDIVLGCDPTSVEKFPEEIPKAVVKAVMDQTVAGVIISYCVKGWEYV